MASSFDKAGRRYLPIQDKASCFSLAFYNTKRASCSLCKVISTLCGSALLSSNWPGPFNSTMFGFSLRGFNTSFTFWIVGSEFSAFVCSVSQRPQLSETLLDILINFWPIVSMFQWLHCTINFFGFMRPNQMSMLYQLYFASFSMLHLLICQLVLSVLLPFRAIFLRYSVSPQSLEFYFEWNSHGCCYQHKYCTGALHYSQIHECHFTATFETALYSDVRWRYQLHGAHSYDFL